MFNPVPMKFLKAVILSRDKRGVLRGLGKLGVLHLAEAPAGTETAPIAPPDNAEERSRCNALIARIDSLLDDFRKSAGDLQENAGETAAPDEPVPLATAEAEVAKIEAACASLKKRIAEMETHAGAVQTVVEQLNSFRDVNLPFSELGKFSFLHFAIGNIPADNIEMLRDKLAGNVVLLELPRSRKDRAVVAVTSRTGRFAMETALGKSGFKAEKIQVDEGQTLADMISTSSADYTKATASLEEMKLAEKGLASGSIRPLRLYRAAAQEEIRILEAEEKFPHTSLTTLITGWIPSDAEEKISAKLSEITGGRCVVETAKPEDIPDVKVPVLLRHSWFLRPFEMLVAGYGMPGYHDLEPTLFVALTYMLMFGMMFGDVGHGLVLLAGGLVAVFKGASRKVRDAGTIVSFAGVSSIIFGFIYGSFFGLESFHHRALWKDPLEGDPMDIMKLAIATGVLVISIGLVLNIVNCIRKREWGHGLFGGFGVVGALFYWGILGCFIKYLVSQDHTVSTTLLAAVIIIPLLGWTLYPPIAHTIARRKEAASGAGFGEAEGGGFVQHFMEALVESFETVLSYMANTISFVRIAAYAMSHAAVLMATFAVAKVVGDAGAGIPKLLVIILGNFIAIALEGVVAGVQALRLEYYEFFGKFFAGGGQAFEPFRLDDNSKK